jgi:hypothetical protein
MASFADIPPVLLGDPGDLALGDGRSRQVRREPTGPSRDVAGELAEGPLQAANAAIGLVDHGEQVGEPAARSLDRLGGGPELDPKLRDRRDAHGVTLLWADSGHPPILARGCPDRQPGSTC